MVAFLLMMTLAGCTGKTTRADVCPKPVWLPEKLEEKLNKDYGSDKQFQSWYVESTNQQIQLKACYVK